MWAQRLVVRIVVHANIPRRRGEGRGGVVHSGYREARVAFTLGAHPGVQVGGQHREESVAGRGTHLGPLLVAVPRCRRCRHVLFSMHGGRDGDVAVVR